VLRHAANLSWRSVYEGEILAPIGRAESQKKLSNQNAMPYPEHTRPRSTPRGVIRYIAVGGVAGNAAKGNATARGSKALMNGVVPTLMPWQSSSGWYATVPK
jgi:hypothetical protein